MRKKGLTPINALWRHLALDARLSEAKVMAAWEELVGPSIGQQTKPTGIKGGVLWVAATSPAWVHQLTMMRGEILAKIHGRFGRELVQEIRFHGGVRQDKEREERPARVRSQQRLRLPDLSDGEVQALQGQVAHIQDPDLRDRALALLVKSLKRQKALKQKGYRPCAKCGNLQPEGNCSRCSLIDG